MNICPCMYTQDSQGQNVCRRCKGDIYACECPLTHSIRCTQHPDHYTNKKGWTLMISEDRKSLHVVPKDDLIEHMLDEDCTCGPTPELVVQGPDKYIYTHHSLDGREKNEPAPNLKSIVDHINKEDK